MMPTIYPVKFEDRLSHSDPLHFSNFFAKQRFHWTKMNERQQMILYFASLHAAVSNPCVPRSFRQIVLPLSKFRKDVYDYKVIRDYFFEVKELGYHIDNSDFQFSTLIPKKLSAVMPTEKKFKYIPPALPKDSVISKVYVQRQNREKILRLIQTKRRFDLKAPVDWILEHDELNFHFVKAGKLQQRDTSVWPVAGIENWPSKLRELLFGPGIDIDSAYAQFLVKTLQEIHSETQLKLLYPDLIRAVNDKVNWRQELCEDVLQLPFTEDNISLVKKICMSVANGSRLSPSILLSGGHFSETAELVISRTHNLGPEQLIRIGNRFSFIAKQFANARKAACLHFRKGNASRANLKKVFESYFEWERAARYSIWESIGRHGIMVHDGIDGVPEMYLNQLQRLIDELGIKLTQ